MKCVFCRFCRAFSKDPANRALLNTLYGEPEHYAKEIWEREPDMSRLYDAYHALETEPARGFAELSVLAELGSRMSMLYLGDAFSRGTGTAIDLAQAAAWFRRAGDAGFAPAFEHLGRILVAIGDFAEAQEALARGIAAGDRLSVYFLGLMCRDAPEPYRDLERARVLLARAAASGNLLAKRDLALLLMGGHFGVLNRLRGLGLWLRGLQQTFAVTWAHDADTPHRSGNSNLPSPSSVPA